MAALEEFVPRKIGGDGWTPEIPDHGDNVYAATPAQLGSLPRLTSRELDVLKLVTAGLTNREIAERLGLSSRTIDAHLRSIYGKISVASRSAATRYAVELGLV
ncbi:MAG TPA: LuxR C-terminal-related transcriptional regulator [Candidatus Dormibacteraeota bacterium]|nr:LuxR C-terminal-related transcriptional regulator [Candidatus Dormibacteraeota bacterium]